ncbi:MAG: hypothetical protein ACREH8_16480 [Opitutaceae bacterium]
MARSPGTAPSGARNRDAFTGQPRSFSFSSGFDCRESRGLARGDDPLVALRFIA